jgi:hypothetical protein
MLAQGEFRYVVSHRFRLTIWRFISHFVNSESRAAKAVHGFAMTDDKQPSSLDLLLQILLEASNNVRNTNATTLID